MKKIFAMILVLFMVGSLLWCDDLHEHYKQGKITLKGVAGFGEKNDWEGLFYDPYKELIVAPDGSIFVTNSRQHTIYKFDQQGNFLKKFGQKGQGPGDLYLPGNPTILDNKYLVVQDYPSRRRITLWNMDGHCVNVVRTEKSTFGTVILKKNRVAYYIYSQHAEEKNGHQLKNQVIVKNIETGMEKVIRELTMLDRSSIEHGQGSGSTIGNFFGEVFLVQTGAGNLAVGVSDRPGIEIYSPDGEKIHSFDLRISPIPTDKKYIKKFKDDHQASLKKEGQKENMTRTERFWYNLCIKTFRNFDYSVIFNKHLPLYKDILVDSEGNFLVFKFSDCQGECNKIYFQVYSKKGEFICETELDKGAYDFEIDSRFKKLYFTGDGVIGLFKNRGDEDEILRLIKSPYPVNATDGAH